MNISIELKNHYSKYSLSNFLNYLLNIIPFFNSHSLSATANAYWQLQFS